MNTIPLGTTKKQIPVVGVGCMRLTELDKTEASKFVGAAMEQGANFFDHADIYGAGKCEEIFAEAIGMNAEVREKIILQSKCSIRPPISTYDMSKEHILSSVDAILKRLQTDYLDILLMHRPDALVEPEEVAEAFDTLEQAGKVRHFGVSNHSPSQIKLLKKYVKQEIVVNQLQLSIPHARLITRGFYINVENEKANDHDGDVLNYCRLHDITIQPWSPFQHGTFAGVFLDNELFPELNQEMDKVAEKYGITKTTLALAWLLRHPAKLNPIVGTTNIGRLTECIAAGDVKLTREEWYDITRAAGYFLP
jgi:predicted oxidoreductase